MNTLTTFYLESEKLQYNPKERNKNIIKKKHKDSETESDSEKSYLQQFTKEELLDYMAHLNFNLAWLFYSILANMTNYCLFAYALVFDPTVEYKMAIVLLIILCYIILFVDTATTILNYTRKDIQNRMPYKRINLCFVVLQLICLISVPVRIVRMFHKNLIVNVTYLVLNLLRFYKMVIYIYFLRNTPLQMQITNLYKKYLLVFILIVHSAVCIWMMLGCHYSVEICDAIYGKGSYWNAGHYNDLFALGKNSTSTIIELDSYEKYLVCFYYIIGGLVSVGFGGASLSNEREMVVCIVMMCLFLLCVHGIFLAEFATYRIQSHTYEAKVTYKILLMENDLTHSRISADLKFKILKYLNEFLTKDNLLRNSNMVQILPESIADELRLEKYWTAITKCKIFAGISESLKRSIAYSMSYDVYNSGDVLYEMGKPANAMYFIANGNIQVLSGEDGESPILSLGSGSSIGQIYLLYSIKPRFKVTVATYTIAYILEKHTFWKVVGTFHKLRQATILHQAFQKCLDEASNLQTQRGNVVKTKTVRKWKCVESRKILSEFKERIKSESKELTSDDIKSNYILSRVILEFLTYATLINIHDEQSFDEIFLKTSWPWILHPQSQFLKIWDRCNFVVLIYVALYYPYLVAFTPITSTVKNLITSDAVHLVYLFDIIIQIFTAIETKNGICWRIADILWVRIEKFSFVMDIISAIPFHWASAIITTNSILGHTFKYFSLNRILKLYKMHYLFERLENSFKKYVLLIKGVKYSLYLLYLGYFLGAVYYINSCYSNDVCQFDTWSMALKRVLMKSEYYTEEHNPDRFVAVYAFLFMLYLVTNTSACLAVNTRELTITSIFSIFGVLIFTYLLSEYCANLTSNKYYEVQQYEFVNTVEKYMANNNIPKLLQQRVLYNLNSVMNIYEGKRQTTLYKDCPSHLFQLIQIGKYSSLVRQIDLFKDLGEDVINMLAVKCTELRLPPNEYLVYSGNLARNIYYIQKGFCRIIEGNVSQKVLGPRSIINSIETVLGIDSLLTVRAQTYATLIKLKEADLTYVFSMNTGIKEKIIACMDEMTLKRGFTRCGDYMSCSFEIKEQNTSWFYFPRAKRNLLNLDYKSVYAKSNWRIMRYILMRHTVLPNGRFLKNWEIFRAICAVMMAIIQPANTIFQYYMPSINYVLWSLYIVGFSDIYIRLHGCYYNQKGILVTHPLYTAKYYLTHAFIIDIFAVMPFHLIMSMLGNVDKPKLIMGLKFNVLLQLYRFSDAFSHKKKNSYRIERVLSRAMRWAPLTFIIFNGFSCAGMIISGDVITKNGMPYLIKKNFSFCNMNRNKYINYDIDELYNYYLICVYWTVISAFSLGFTQFHPVTIAEVIFKIAAVVTGYIFVMHNTVFIAHSRFVVNQKLTIYQNYMKQLIIYMKMENIPKPLQTKTINHFEHMWRMTNGVQSNTITDMFHLPLKTDFVLQLYEETLNSVPGFTEDDKAFFRIIGMSVEETYLRRNASIISLNDIVDTIYIVHKGEVTVYGPANTYFAVLGIGSMFGNIDDVQYTRSMISAVTNSTTDLLKIHTNLFYKIVQNFPIIKARMERHILLENLSYMKSKAIRSQVSLLELGDTHKNIHPLLVFFSKRYFYIVMVFVSFVSCWLASYQAAFANSTILLYFLYFFDALHIAKVCISLYTPFYNKRGDLITDKRQIRKRYMVLTKFYFDCLTIFPYEVICLLAEPMQRESYRTTIGAYRVLRAFNIYQFFDVHENKLNSSALSVRIGATLTYCIVFIHLCACIAYGYSCPGHQCNKDGWIYWYSSKSKQHIKRCGDPYLCSTYYVLSIFTSTGFNGHYPRTRLDLMFCIFIVILSKYIIAVLIGDLTALIRNYSYSLSQYNFELQIFNVRMRNSFVSGPFYEKLIRYFHNLWVARMGRQVPVLLSEAPQFLVEEINLAAYGHHIYDNLVFARCHKDFLRTLTRMLKVRTFFVGDTICYQEDVNNTMYFIHKGIVDVYSIYEHQEIHVDQLQDLDCFGMVQGLYPQTPHTHTYKSNAVTIVLLLKFEDWHILLKFFPATKFEIYKNMKILDKL